MDHLDGDLSLEHPIGPLAEVDATHPSGPDLLHQAIGSDTLSSNVLVVAGDRVEEVVVHSPSTLKELIGCEGGSEHRFDVVSKVRGNALELVGSFFGSDVEEKGQVPIYREVPLGSRRTRPGGVWTQSPPPTLSV
jgi:hypothetical protein